MNHPFSSRRQSWPKKFAAALRGWVLGVRGHSSFLVHVPVAIAVIAAAIYLQVNLLEWCALVLSIAIVLAAELFNSALESLAKAVSRSKDPHIAQALDIASGAVLLAAVGAVIVGLIIFIPRLAAL